MKKLILLLLLLALSVLFLAGNAFAYLDVPETANMLLVGFCLVDIAVLGKKKFFRK